MRLAVLLLLLAGCTTEQAMCSAVQTDLEQCGLPSDGLDCSRLDYDALSDLTHRMRSSTSGQSTGQSGCRAKSDDDAVDPRLCALAGWACPDSPTPAVTSAATANPLVFVGGIDDTAVFDWNPNVLDAVRAAGGEAHHVPVVSWQPTAVRAADLWQSLRTLSQELGGRKLDLVCYAVAGLDCRYLVSPGGLFAHDDASRAEVLSVVASITTMNTPHRGTRVADAAILALQSSTVTEVLQTIFGIATPETIPDDATLVTTLKGLTVDALTAFDQTVIDEPSIYTQSFAGQSELFGQANANDEADTARLCVDELGNAAYQRHAGTVDALNPILMITAPFSRTSRDEHGDAVSTPSDGMIALASARWAHFRGCLPADHYDVIGQIANSTRDPLTGFDARTFYPWLAADLASRGL